MKGALKDIGAGALGFCSGPPQQQQEYQIARKALKPFTNGETK